MLDARMGGRLLRPIAEMNAAQEYVERGVFIVA
jgi:hypothetical protein